MSRLALFILARSPSGFRNLIIVVNARMALESYLPRTYSSRKLEKLFQQNRKQNWRAFLLACAPKRTYTLNKINLVVANLSVFCHAICASDLTTFRDRNLSLITKLKYCERRKTNEKKPLFILPLNYQLFWFLFQFYSQVFEVWELVGRYNGEKV